MEYLTSLPFHVIFPVKTKFVSMDVSHPFKIIAHRGVSGLFPENTLSAICAGIALPSDYVEIDVRLTKDGIPVVIHDRNLQRTAMTNLPVHELTLEEIAHFDAGSWFDPKFEKEKIPLLKDVLEVCWNQTGLMIEIKKCPQPDNIIVNAVFNTISCANSLPIKLIIGSLSHDTVSEIQKKSLEIQSEIPPMGIIEKLDLIDPSIKIGIKHMAIWYKLITPSLINLLRDEGIEAWAFTVDDPKIACFLASIGVTGIISNVPQRLMNLSHI